MISSPLDQVTLVNANDEFVGSMDKVEAHRGEGKLHRAISVFLLNEQGELLIQQRSAKKIVGALQWANTCCGNVRPNETYLECAQRRLREELGIVGVHLTPMTKFTYQVRCNEEFSEHEIDSVFSGHYSGEVFPNPEEVAAIRWIDKKNMKIRTKDIDTSFAPWVPFLLQQASIQKVLYGI